MKCKKCKSKWVTDQRVSVSLAFCPFCGESFADNTSITAEIAQGKKGMSFSANTNGEC